MKKKNEDLLSNVDFLRKIAKKAWGDAYNNAMEMNGYVVIWDNKLSCVVKKYKDGTIEKI